jgi:hypothetical protein
VFGFRLRRFLTPGLLIKQHCAVLCQYGETATMITPEYCPGFAVRSIVISDWILKAVGELMVVEIVVETPSLSVINGEPTTVTTGEVPQFTKPSIIFESMEPVMIIPWSISEGRVTSQVTPGGSGLTQ